MNEELKVIISAEIGKLKQNVEKAKQTVKGFQEQVKQAGANVDDNFSKMGSAIANGAKAAATALAAAGTAILALGASTAEYRTEQAKLVTAFEDAGASAAQAKETYNDLYRVLGDSGQAVEAANHLAKLTTNEKELAQWTDICQGVYATFGDSLPIEGLTEAANETAKVGQVTGSLADALNWAGISEDAFNEKLAACNDEAEREKLIRETLNGLYSEAAAKFEENNAAVIEQNEANARLQETLAALGEAVAPVVAAFTSFASDALAAVLPYIQQLASDYLPQLKDLLTGVADALAVAFEWVVQHQSILGTMAAIIAGIAAAIGLYNTVAAVKAAMAALEVTTVWGLVTAYAAQAAAMIVAIAPYLLIVAAIAAVIAIIVVCVKHWDEIKEAVANAWQSIQEKTQAAVSAVVNKFNDLKAKATEKIQALKQAAVDKFESIKSGISQKIQNAASAVSTGFQNMVSNAQAKISAIVSAVSGKFSSIKSKISENINAAKDAVKNALSAIGNFFSGASWSLPKIKLPHISISGTFSINPPSVPKFSISWNALGGVFDKPTLFNYGGSLQGIGEAGAEAVVPLENNLKWLDKLASMLNERMGGGSTPIVLNVDGKVFAETAISTINKRTRQTGKLALNLM